MEDKINKRVMEDVAVIGGLIGVQFIYAGNAVLMGYVMSLGLTSFTIIIFTSLAAFFILFPVAFCVERRKWPKNWSFKLIMQLLFLSFGGLAFQTLLLKGINLASPAMATAMPNLAPGLIFIIAWTFGLEKVNLSNKNSKVKILGTLLCVMGALIMSIMQSISTPATEKEVKIQLSSTPSDSIFDMQKIIGCLYLMASILILSSNIVLQAFALGDFPAPMSLSAITSLLGAFMTAIVQLVEDHEVKTGWPLVSFKDLIGYSFLGGAVSGICLSFSGWAIEKRGPVFVSMFSPIGTVSTVIYSVVTLGDSINFGSIAGMFLMFTGLYLVLWAKGKEVYADGHELESEFDAEKPLLC
ncbi:WAT1-related protein At5g47470-like [Gastrolobium bilobum]|uniref:WAT1-related protein At5g47470-like n=1 Tax=Gastrolobium bilobum TaxID=150636 RepID=UPI002AAF277F|nr:WAT1-related protein At5g47470-like [Gastrolobium bilobum]